MKQAIDAVALYQNQNSQVYGSSVCHSLTTGGGTPGRGYQAVVYCIDCQGGKGNANITEGVAPPLMAESNGTPHAVCYRLCSKGSNSWRSDNPKAGCYETDVASTVYTKVDPTCNQGGVFVVSVDCRNGTVDGEKTMTLQAKDSGGMSLNCTPVVIVSDMRGNNMGGVTPTITSNGPSHANDYMPIVIRKLDADGGGRAELRKLSEHRQEGEA